MKKNYLAPSIELLDVVVEQGFAQSPLPPAGDFEGTTPDAN